MLNVGASKIDITLPTDSMKLSRQQLLSWVRMCANSVSHYYGKFPVPHLTLRISAGYGSEVRHGVTYPKDGGLIIITVGRDSEVSDLKDDWVLTHEMIHLAMPSLDDNHHWLEEGISTYVEPVARAQTGVLPIAEVWRQFAHDMDQGEPSYGDRGLDNTPSWGRTYWGGAMFCLMADVKIRERTHNRRGLQDALRAVLSHGGTITEDWDIEQMLKIGDKATGTTVLMDLYNEMKDKPDPVDLDALWKKLGVALENRHAVLNDKAPDAGIRKAITASAAKSNASAKASSGGK